MNKKTILWIIATILLSVAISYGVLYYLQWQDKKEFERMKKEKQAEQEELTQEDQNLEESIAPVSQEKPIIFSDKEKSLLEGAAPAELPSKELDPEMQKLLESIQPK